MNDVMVQDHIIISRNKGPVSHVDDEWRKGGHVDGNGRGMCTFKRWESHMEGVVASKGSKAEKIRGVVKVITKCKAKVVFIQESKLTEVKSGVAKRLKGSLYGGLDVESKIILDRAIILVGFLSKSGLRVGLMNVYAPNDPIERKFFLESVSSHIDSLQLPVILGGDFNTIKSPEEKMGNCLNYASMSVFADFIQKHCLIDYPMSGSSFTWFRGSSEVSASRLDRFLLSAEVVSSVSNLSLKALPRGLSDHNPIFLNEEQSFLGKRPFKWFSHWADDRDFVAMVETVMQQQSNRNLPSALRKVKEAAKCWVVDKQSKDVDNVVHLEKRISDLESSLIVGGCNEAVSSELKSLKSALWSKHRKEEREWLQKSRIRWFNEGDKNTKFFHLTASMRRAKNQIFCIRVGDRVVNEQSEVLKAFETHFRVNYNKSSTLPVKHFPRLANKLSVESASNLEVPFSEEEVWSAITLIDGNRAPGPDGFNLDFYTKFWPSLKPKVMLFFEDFYRGCLVDKSVNHSFITLIPKKESPVSFEDFRPISLVSSLYKILAKVLSRRLSVCISEVVGENQFAFTPGKQISDCSLIANEVLDDLKRNKKEAVVFKADFRKAYDTIDWSFLDFLFKSLGFGIRWRKWINVCLSTAMVSVLVNGVPSKWFPINRGLRQGCPISPLLFNIIGEALSSLIHRAVESGLFRGVDVGPSGFSLSHLHFADDLIIFTHSNLESVKNIKRFLRIFELASGLRLNTKKTNLFGVNLDASTLSNFARDINCSTGSFPTLYLGLPLGLFGNSLSIWKPIIIKFRSKLEVWKGKLLSFGGVKSVLSNLPVHYLALFQLPTSVAKELNGLISSFIWGSNSGRSIHWIKWDVLCRPKDFGGLGLYDLKVKNRALLNKWLWRYGNEPNNLWRRVIDAKYGYSPSNLLPASLARSNFSSYWKNIIKPLSNPADFFSQHLRFSLGDGNSINFWDDYWTDYPSLKLAFPRLYSVAVQKSGKVSEFGCKTLNGWVWNIVLRRELFSWEVEIMEVFLKTLDKAARGSSLYDCIKWGGDSSGVYNPKSFCVAFHTRGAISDKIWNMVWKNFAPPKVEAFLWKVVHGRVATRTELGKRGIVSVNSLMCVLYGKEPETVDHLFCNCEASWRIWQRWCSLWQIHLVFPEKVNEFVVMWDNQLIKPSLKPIWSLALFGIIWTIWLMRNEVSFNNKSFHEMQTFDLALFRIAFWAKCKWPSSSFSTLDFTRFPILCEIVKEKPIRLLRGFWVAPPVGSVKFNVDASVLGSYGEAAIGGILRDHVGSYLVKFSKSIGLSDPTGAELEAILEACQIFHGSKWFSSHALIIETDSLLAVNWISMTSQVPPAFLNLVQVCRSIISQYNWTITFVFRESNCFAHGLARERLNAVSDFLWVAM
ncbi:hypothetical protein GQ457_01G054770 [Hibiscus cannabinus]